MPKIGFELPIYFTVHFETFEYSTNSNVDKATPCFEFEDIGSQGKNLDVSDYDRFSVTQRKRP